MRKIIIKSANGMIEGNDFVVADYYEDEYKVPTPQNDWENDAIREKIAEKYNDKPKKLRNNVVNKNYRVSKNILNMDNFGRFNNKVVYEYKEATEFKMYEDGTYTYDKVTSEDNGE